MRFFRADLASFTAVHEIILIDNLADPLDRNSQNIRHLPVLSGAAEVENDVAQIKIDKLWRDHLGFAFCFLRTFCRRPIPLRCGHLL